MTLTSFRESVFICEAKPANRKTVNSLQRGIILKDPIRESPDSISISLQTTRRSKMVASQSIASLVAMATLVTAVSSGWELSRTIRDKRQEAIAKIAQETSRELIAAYLDNRISRKLLVNYNAQLWEAVDQGSSTCTNREVSQYCLAQTAN